MKGLKSVLIVCAVCVVLVVGAFKDCVELKIQSSIVKFEFKSENTNNPDSHQSYPSN